jgi:ribosome-associated protein
VETPARREGKVQITRALAIPMVELRFRFSRSSGPGGQHVNRSATRVELLFDLEHSPSLSEEQRQRASRALASYLDQDGVLHLVSQSSRSQLRNRQEVVDRFRNLMQKALKRQKRRRPTRPSLKARQKRLEEKRNRGKIKKRRRPVRPDDY